MDLQGGADRRDNSRIAIQVEMRVVLFNAGLSGVLTWQQLMSLRKGILEDISTNGMKMKTNDLDSNWFYHLLSGGIHVAMKFKLPGIAEEVNVVAQVVWIKENTLPDGYKYIIGLRFFQIKPQDHDRISDFIAKTKESDQKKKSNQ